VRVTIVPISVINTEDICDQMYVREGVEGMFLKFSKEQLILQQIPCGCLLIHFNCDTVYLELNQTPEVKGSILNS
jgi:hypothetical protein